MQLTQGIGISGYTLEERIGAGAAGEVWSARLGEQRVAVKFMNHVPDPDGKYARSLQAEVEALRHLQHPNVPRLYDYDLQTERRYLVMTLAEGMGWDVLIASGAVFSIRLDRRLNLLGQIANALTSVHGQGYIHRDVKPGNIRGTTTPYLLDFGVSIERQAVSGTSSQVGTGLYMPPLGDALDENSDTFGFALVAYEMLFGRHPFYDPLNPPTMIDETRRMTTLRLRQHDWHAPTRLQPAEIPGDLRGVDMGRLEAMFVRAFGPAQSRWPDLDTFMNALGETVLTTANQPHLDHAQPPQFDAGDRPTPDTAHLIAEHQATEHPPAPDRTRLIWGVVMVAIILFSLAWVLVMSRYGSG
ncbi:MAG: serine/threonine protein kinase [Chloroflexi bacterium]|nr:serine/threonine protein kinase [Chloroflexota bacterium]MCC6894464.1 serine/threonine protein kinase [Anaerolineae bacterium]